MTATELNAAATSDTGLLRESNEDRCWMDGERGVFLVVDGVGGQAAGAVAAETAVEAIRESIFEEGAAEERVRQSIARANQRIYERGQRDEACRGMACVLTLAVVENGEVTVGHVGDSRFYLIWNGSIRKLTSDHSPVGEDEDAGALSETEAMQHPRRNEVFRDVGSRLRSAGDADFIEIRRCRLHADAAILLCSDGLTDHLTAAQVREIVERYDGDAGRVTASLVEAANAAGGRDNISAVFAAGPEFRALRRGTTRPRFSTTRIRRRAAVFTGRAAFLVYGLLLGLAVWAVMRFRG
ncbi:MAG TPA: protein phosphatase 2C domain-containing protein [Bryobacteraceae bacterium]|nr:protein phosphatase 2C domain-containing protein [Bryobacteraceae bacterium]